MQRQIFKYQDKDKRLHWQWNYPDEDKRQFNNINKDKQSVTTFNADLLYLKSFYWKKN